MQLRYVAVDKDDSFRKYNARLQIITKRPEDCAETLFRHEYRRCILVKKNTRLINNTMSTLACNA